MLLRTTLLLLSLLLIVGCGGDGNKKDNKPEIPPVASLTLDNDDIHLFPFFDDSRSITIKVIYEGDEVSIGYPAGETPLSGLGWSLREIDKNSQELTIAEVVPGIADGDEPVTVNLLVSTGTPGSNFYAAKTLRVTVTPRNPLTLTPLKGREVIRGEVGYEQDSAILLLNANLQLWQATSNMPGVLITPSSGVGSTYLHISAKNTVDTDLIKVTVKAGGRTVTHDVPIDITTSEFIGLPSEVSFSKQKRGMHLPVQIPIILLNSGSATWNAIFPEWLLSSNVASPGIEWLPGETGAVLTLQEPGRLTSHASGVTSFSELELFVNHHFPFVEGMYEGFIDVNVPVPAKTLNQKIKITLPFEKHRLQSNQSAFSFSDYGVSSVHKGSFNVNAGTPVPFAFDLADSILATASEPWVNVVVNGLTIHFSLDVAGLADGFHFAEIKVDSKYSTFFVGDTIRIGYYKTNSPMPTGQVANLPISEDVQVVSDKLGPWVYYVDRAANTPALEIVKYNVFTHQVDNVFSIPGADFLSTLAVSNDGAMLYARDDKKMLHKINLPGAENITSIQTESEGDNIHQQLSYAEINGKALLVTHDDLNGVDGIAIDVDSGKKIPGGEKLTGITPRPRGDLAFIDGQWIKYDFSHLNQIIEVSSPVSFHTSYLPDVDSVQRPVVVANNGKVLTFADYSSSTGVAHLYNETIRTEEFDEWQANNYIELDNLEKYPVTQISSLSELAYIADYVDGNGSLSDRVVVSNNGSDERAYPLIQPSEQLVQSWFSLSADEKFITYLVRNGSDIALYVQPMR